MKIHYKANIAILITEGQLQPPTTYRTEGFGGADPLIVLAVRVFSCLGTFHEPLIWIVVGAATRVHFEPAASGTAGINQPYGNK